MSGYVGDLSPEQEQTLSEFRKLLSDVLQPKHDDHLLLQFLRARRFDQKKASDMFRRHLEFRRQFDEEQLLSEYEPPQLLVQYLLPPLIGYDKEGSPVRLINAGPCDIKGVVSCFRRQEIRRCITWFLDIDKEDMRRRYKKSGIYVETRTFIFDLNGLSLRQIYHKEVYELVISFLKLYEGNYPENLKVAYVINTPPFFAWMFGMIKALLSEDTVRKVRLYGNGGWQEDLLAAMDADILPVIYGGTRTDDDGDPRCRNMIPQGGAIPTEHYLRNRLRMRADDPDAQEVRVCRRSKMALSSLCAEACRDELTWEVDCLSKGGDVWLWLLYEEEEDPLIPPIKVSDEMGREAGRFPVPRTGRYTLMLDNSHSLLRSKTVLFKASVTNLIGPDTRIIQDTN